AAAYAENFAGRSASLLRCVDDGVDASVPCSIFLSEDPRVQYVPGRGKTHIEENFTRIRRKQSACLTAGSHGDDAHSLAYLTLFWHRAKPIRSGPLCQAERM